MNKQLNGNELQYIKNLCNTYSKNINRNYQKHEDIQKCFHVVNYKIKQDIIQTILRRVNSPRTVNVFCSSFGFNYLHHLIYTNIREIYCYDMDPSVRELSETFFKNQQKERYINFIQQDIWLDVNFKCQADLNIIMACEHLPPLKYWEGFKTLGASKYYALSSTNFDGVKDHNNTVNSIEEFKNQLPDMMDILYAEEKDYPGYGKQFTIIGFM